MANNIFSEKECKDIDIREQNPIISQNPEIKKYFTKAKNQGSMGWCFAFTAADLITASIGKPISSLHMSLIYNGEEMSDSMSYLRYKYDLLEKKLLPGKYKFDEIATGGFVNEAINRASGGYLCLEENLPFSYEDDNTYFALRKLEDFKQKTLESNQDNAEYLCEIVKNLFPKHTFNKKELLRIGEDVLRRNLNSVLKDAAKRVCAGKMIKIPKLIGVRIEKDSHPYNKNYNYLKAINNLLDQGKPLAVGYELEQISSTEGSHSSIILARKWINGSCKYLVRNSWGNSCGVLISKVVDCNKETGTFWIKDKDLNEISSSFNYIK